MKTHTEPIRLATPEQTQLSEDISPFDIPKSITASCNPDLETLEIQFRYISEEPTTALDLPADARVVLGKNSHRIYALSIQRRNLTDFSHTQLLFLQAVVNIPSSLSGSVSQKDLPESNYKVIRRLISINSHALENYAKKPLLTAYA